MLCVKTTHVLLEAYFCWSGRLVGNEDLFAKVKVTVRQLKTWFQRIQVPHEEVVVIRFSFGFLRDGE